MVRRPILSGFPASQMVKLRYVQEISLDPGVSGSVASYVFRGNSLFDPDYTGTGHQPMLFDQYSAVYSTYQVLGAKITMSHIPNTANNTNNYFGICKGTSPNAISTFSDTASLLESKLVGSNYKMTGLTTQAMAGNGYPITVTKNLSCKRHFGVNNVRDNSALQALTSGNPEDIVYLICWSAGASGVDTTTQGYKIQIDYIVNFTQPNTVDGS